MSTELQRRVDYFEKLFRELSFTSSTNRKKQIVKCVPDAYKSDWIFIVETLSGKHKFGYRYPTSFVGETTYPQPEDFLTVKEMLEHLLEPMRIHNLTETHVDAIVYPTLYYRRFLAPIVNRTLKIGIGMSLLVKSETSPMLAKSWDGHIDVFRTYAVSEKLDGNRCIAMYDGEKWNFISRNGKPMYVDFSMEGLPTEYIYDGEVLSRGQADMSDRIYRKIKYNIDPNVAAPRSQFNSTSGTINRHTTNKDLVYNIFDIVDPVLTYDARRSILDEFVLECDDVRILPVFRTVKPKFESMDAFTDMMDIVVAMGGEGIMLNDVSAKYQHKRTADLLKMKPVRTMDMVVDSFTEGTGKYEGAVGALNVHCEGNDGKYFTCAVGTGLSDEQRFAWAENPEEIVGKIVEIAYFDISQPEAFKGSNYYSLRFPRLKKIRYDKSSTSQY